jgi:hypothetical protein
MLMSASVLCVGFLALLSIPVAQGALILNFDSVSITGQPGDVFTLTGSITHVDPSEDLVSIQSSNLTSSVLQLITVTAPGSVPYPGGFSGNILTVQILVGALGGNYPTNTLSLTYDSINGRTFSTNAANFEVDVQAAAVPEPGTLILALASMACMACLGAVRRMRLRRVELGQRS